MHQRNNTKIYVRHKYILLLKKILYLCSIFYTDYTFNHTHKMGARKRIRAARLKEENKQNQAVGAKLRNCPTSPRKMRLVVDLIRGQEVNKALGILHYTKKYAASTLERLLKSAINNWEIANVDNRRTLEEGGVVIKTIFVDSARMLKRISPAPQGRAYRIRKRSNHITLILDTLVPTAIPAGDNAQNADSIDNVDANGENILLTTETNLNQS
jgi:large subunit ribosomal protein L22